VRNDVRNDTRNAQSLTRAAYGHKYDESTKGQPGINLGTAQNKAWFAASKLRILPHQIYRRPVPDHLTDDMLKRAAKTPAESEALVKSVFGFLSIDGPVGPTATSFVSLKRDYHLQLEIANMCLDFMPASSNHTGSSESQEHHTSVSFHHLR